MRTLRELSDLTGRVAVVTGAAGHIGRMCCQTLAEQGATVVLVDNRSDATREFAHQLASDFRLSTLALTIDLTQDAQLRGVPSEVLDRFGHIDILIHCAALVGSSALPGWAVPFEEQSAATWRLAMETNLTAPFVLTQACAQALRQSGHGSVVNFASIYGFLGPDCRMYQGVSMGNPAAYAASKGGLLQLTRWLATVLAPDVRVNAITPGGLKRQQPIEFQERYARRTPLGRMAVEEDLKGAVAYLASDLSSFVTGQNMVVDGGWSSW